MLFLNSRRASPSSLTQCFPSSSLQRGSRRRRQISDVQPSTGVSIADWVSPISGTPSGKKRNLQIVGFGNDKGREWLENSAQANFGQYPAKATPDNGIVAPKTKAAHVSRTQPSNFLRLDQAQALIKEIDQSSEMKSAIDVRNGGRKWGALKLAVSADQAQKQQGLMSEKLRFVH